MGLLTGLLLTICVLLLIFIPQWFARTSDTEPQVLTTGLINVSPDPAFACIMPSLTVEEFEALGFQKGDSLDFVFDNGQTYTDLPYYGGFYGKYGDLFLCAYPGYSYLTMVIMNGNPTWEELGMTEGTRLTITLHETGKYKGVQDAFCATYSDDPADYPNDAAFANYRMLRGGRLKDHMFYRGASPVNNQRNRTDTVCTLMEQSGIGAVINLSDSPEKLEEYRAKEDYHSDVYDALEQDDKVWLLNLNTQYKSERFRSSVSRALYEACLQEAPIYIHCLEGKDRTGYVCALILALADASYDEIVSDYMKSFENYYDISDNGTEDGEYRVVASVGIDPFLQYLCHEEGGDVSNKSSFRSGAVDHLRSGGLSDSEILSIRDRIIEKQEP